MLVVEKALPGRSKRTRSWFVLLAHKLREPYPLVLGTVELVAQIGGGHVFRGYIAQPNHAVLPCPHRSGEVPKKTKLKPHMYSPRLWCTVVVKNWCPPLANIVGGIVKKPADIVELPRTEAELYVTPGFALLWAFTAPVANLLALVTSRLRFDVAQRKS